MPIATLIPIIAQLLPTATSLILNLFHPDGTSTVLVMVQNAETLNAQNAAALQELMAKTAPKAETPAAAPKA